jgi:hypothetical protein
MQATWTDMFILLVVLAGVVLLLRTKPLQVQVMHFLPEQSLWDTVMVAEEVQRDHVYALVCPHVNCVSYRRVDHRAGPGSDADNYSGVVCVDCGRILNETKEN